MPRKHLTTVNDTTYYKLDNIDLQQTPYAQRLLRACNLNAHIKNACLRLTTTSASRIKNAKSARERRHVNASIGRSKEAPMFNIKICE